MPKTVEDFLEEGNRFYSLTVKDLLEARDAYHVFMTRKKNVIGTAIGRNRFRKEGVSPRTPKTFANSEVRKYSWPCVIVVVEDWVDDASFGKGHGVSSEDYLPQRLYLPDGREIPVCVIKAAW